MSNKVKFHRYQTNNPQIDRNFQSVEQALNFLSSNPLLGEYIIIENQTIGTSDTVVNHGLNKTPVWWIILDRNADSRIWKTAEDKQTITLKASATTTASLYLF